MKPKCVDLFSGAGGFTLGMAKAGFDVVGHVEYAKECLETYETNKVRGGFPNSELIGRDITQITDEQVLAFKKKHKHIQTIVGGAPCQSFSTCGKREIGDPRDNLFLHYVRFVNLIEPSGFIFENVPGLLSKKSPEGELMIDIIMKTFRTIGYHVQLTLLNAANYGVPQNRRRVFIFGRKEDKPIPLPLPLNFGKKEGTKNPERKDTIVSYRKCAICEKYYGSYVITDKKEKVCLFCYNHNINFSRSFKGIDYQKGWVVVPKDIKVPAAPDEMLYVRHIEKRSSADGISQFLYCEEFKDEFGNIKWLERNEVRQIADDDQECDSAEVCVYNKIIVKPMTKAIRGF